MKKRICLVIISLGCVGFLSFFNLNSYSAQETGKYGGILKVAVNVPPETLDPHVTGNRVPYSIAMNIFDTLVYRDVDNTFKSGLATKWSWNKAGTVYTFILRDGVKFHDGTPFNAETVAYNFNRIVDPKTKSKFAASAIKAYKSARAVDPLTVEVTFSAPISPSALLDTLSQAYFGMVSPKQANQWGPDEFGRHPVGTGPFIFREWTAQNRITLLSNKDYNWTSPVFKHNGRPYLDQLVFIVVPEDTTRSATLETGESDLVVDLAEESIETFNKSKDFQVIPGEVVGCPVIFWMNTNHPILSDIKVRRAILHGFSSDLMAKTVYKGLVVPVCGPLTPATWAYNPAIEEMYPYDIEKAKALLEEAGWKINPKSGIREKGGQPLKIDLYDMMDRRRGEFFQAQMKEIGIDVEARLVSGDLLWKAYQDGTHGMASLWFIYSDPDVLRLICHSSSIKNGYNFSQYKDEALDKMLMDAAAETDREKRKQMYFDIQKKIMSTALMVPINASRPHSGLKKNIQGYRLDRGQYPVLYDVRFE